MYLVIVEDPSTGWKPIMVANCYGNQKRTIEIVSETAVWYSTGLLTVPLRWVLIRSPQEEFKAQALCCAPTLMPSRSKSSGGLSDAGKWSSLPAGKCASFWALRDPAALLREMADHP